MKGCRRPPTMILELAHRTCLRCPRCRGSSSQGNVRVWLLDKSRLDCQKKARFQFAPLSPPPTGLPIPSLSPVPLSGVSCLSITGLSAASTATVWLRHTVLSTPPPQLGNTQRLFSITQLLLLAWHVASRHVQIMCPCSALIRYRGC